MPFSIRLPLAIVLSLLLLTLLGCGEKTVAAGVASKLGASQSCFDCHGTRASSVTGRAVADEWKRSVHNTANGAGCADCHEPEAGHPDSCNLCHGGAPPSAPPNSVNDVSKNPDKDGKCDKCHRKGVSWGMSTYDGSPVDNQFLHYSTGTRANFVSTNYIKNCRKCHNPHDTSTAREKLQQWSRSGHGDTLSAAKTSVDFKVRGSSVPAKDNVASSCVRCHTSTGFITYVSSGFSDVRALPDMDGVRGDFASSPNPRTIYLDKSREAINCNVCHDDGRSNDGSAYSYKVRVVPQVFAYFNYSSTPLHQSAWNVKYKQTYSDFGTSNVCVVCHTGREIGLIIKMASAQGMDFSAQNRINAHVSAAASTISALGGFHFYTSSAKYQNPVYFQHDKIGLSSSSPAYTGGRSGPCIGCHMKNDRSHYYLPVREASGTIVAIPSDEEVCSKCHNSSNPNSAPWTIVTLGEKKEGIKAALKSLQQMILRPNHDSAKALGTYDAVNGTISSYSKTKWVSAFGDSIVAASGNPLNNNATDGITAGAYTMGATFNYEMILGDPGAYAHNSRYVRRLIFDSIDWLYDGEVNGNTLTALKWLNGQNILGNTTKYIDDTTYANALAYLCETKSDLTGSLGLRP